MAPSALEHAFSENQLMTEEEKMFHRDFDEG